EGMQQALERSRFGEEAHSTSVGASDGIDQLAEDIKDEVTSPTVILNVLPGGAAAKNTVKAAKKTNLLGRLWRKLTGLFKSTKKVEKAIDDIPATKLAVDPNKLNHIFGKAEHGLEGVVKQYGSQEAAYR